MKNIKKLLRTLPNFFLLLAILGQATLSAPLWACDAIRDQGGLVKNHLTSFTDDYNNGYPESRYHQILDIFQQTYDPIIANLGGTFHILRDWSDGAVNAWAWRIGNEYHLEVPGGMSRYHLIIEEAFITTICHELGHLLGGTPARNAQISYEGQSDYFASSHCMKRMLMIIRPFAALAPDAERDQLCGNNIICHRALAGARSVANYFASLDGTKNLSLINESSTIVTKTLDSHPSSQCRLDTMKRGFLCPVGFDDDVSYTDYRDGSCHREFFPEFSRPLCWFRP